MVSDLSQFLLNYLTETIMKKQRRHLQVISTVILIITLFVEESSPNTDVLQERLSIQSKDIHNVA